VLVARGTSDNAALFGRYLLELTTGIPVSLCASSIHTLYHARLDLGQTLVVGISQSGEGTDVNLALKCVRAGSGRSPRPRLTRSSSCSCISWLRPWARTSRSRVGFFLP